MSQILKEKSALKNNIGTFNIENVNMEAFLKDVLDMKKEIEESLGDDDIKHLKKVITIGRLCSVIGFLTSWIAPNPISMLGLGFGRSNRWIIMHHIGHRGYDKVPNIPEKYHSRTFARGWRRFVDWFDWMMPEAWKYEHNVLHHSYTGESKDPDIVETNSELLRARSYPMFVRYSLLTLLAMFWKPFYYAPNTTQSWHDKSEGKGKEKIAGLDVNYKAIARDLIFKCYLPYSLTMFVLFPLLFYPLGWWAVFSVFCNSFIAEILTNLHSFMVIAPNHTGDDLYIFRTKPKDKAERYLRQVIGSANLDTGSDLIDCSLLWLNYQIEHHVFPDIPMLKLQQFQPRFKALCEKHGVPYVQGNVFYRMKKTIDIAVGKTSMLILPNEAEFQNL